MPLNKKVQVFPIIMMLRAILAIFKIIIWFTTMLINLAEFAIMKLFVLYKMPEQVFIAKNAKNNIKINFLDFYEDSY